ncbi:MAG: PAS domain S-box protein [Burkholderiales bacterium]
MREHLSWVVVAWSMMAAASLTLALIHLVVWFRQRAAYGYLLFSTMAASAAAFAGFELVMMRTTTPDAYAQVLRWAQVPLAVFVLSIVGFVRFYLESGRTWLAWAACGMRLWTLVLTFTTGVNANFTAITSIETLRLWGGESVHFPVGILNPWGIVPQVANALLLLFVIDAAVTLWRRGDARARRRAVAVGGSLALCIAFAASTSALVLAGAMRAPTLVAPSMLFVVLAMGYELVTDVIASVRLASELRAKEAALRRNETRMRAVVEAVPSVILLVDRAGTIQLANGQVERQFGYAPGELIGRNVDLLVPDLRAAQREAMGTPVPNPVRAHRTAGRRKDGGELPLEAGLNPLPAEDGPLVLVSLVDLTERLRSEREAERQRNELAHLSRVSTLGALSGSLAHELNQPLAAILSNAQAAQRFLAMPQPRLDQVEASLADIVKSDRRAAAVIGRIRALLKREEVRHEVLDINETIHDVLRLLHNDLLQRGVEVALDCATALPEVDADRIQIQQVLVNFIVNACEAIDEVGGPRTIRIRSFVNAAGQVELAVADSGPGIAPDDLERIFEPFVSTKRHGLGLGLAICRSITESHRGRMRATNNADGGATLHLELPPRAIAEETRRDVADRVRG